MWFRGLHFGNTSPTCDFAHIAAHINDSLSITYKDEPWRGLSLTWPTASLLETVVRAELCGRRGPKPPSVVLSLADYSH